MISQTRYIVMLVIALLLWGVAGRIAGPDELSFDPPREGQPRTVRRVDAVRPPGREVQLTCHPNGGEEPARGNGTFYISHNPHKSTSFQIGDGSLSLTCYLKP